MKKWSKLWKTANHRKNIIEDDFKASESSKNVTKHHTSKLWKTKMFDFSLGFHCFAFQDQRSSMIRNFRNTKKSVPMFPEEKKQNHQKSCQNPLVYHKKRSPKFWFGRKFSQTRDFGVRFPEIWVQNTVFPKIWVIFQWIIPKISSLRKFSTKPKLSATLFMSN